ncbi:PilW family protein [Neptuniibacter sp.]|uniref:PilW family protein n=1 Tax=Neptuniibacter sp. TaxID=1962643 RepID=UPI00263835EA|nr:PilW family protein [Neptuniibacter sp.]MCP4598361.1 hypothetical protein [Neptuniibacter sp.]
MSKQAGVSLVEIMVALTISMFIMLGIFQVFVGTNRSNNLGNGLARVQETGRFAIDFMVRDLRLVGYQGCIDNEAIDVTILSDDADDLTTNLDTTELQAFRIAADNSIDGTAPAELDDDDLDLDEMQVLSDVIYVQHASAQSFALSGAATTSGSTATVPLTESPTGVGAGDVMIITNCEAADMFTVETAAGTNITLTTTGGENSALPSALYDAGDLDENRAPAEVMSFDAVAYYVKDTGRNNSTDDDVFGLYQMNLLTGVEQEILEGVERIVVDYGQKLSTDNIRYVPITDANLDLSEVDRLRVSVLVASNERVLQQDDANTYQMLSTTVVPAGGTAPTYANDRRLRRVFSTSFVMRNRAR